MRMEADQQFRLLEIGQLSGEGSKYHQGDDLERAVECYDKAYKLAREVNDDKTERTCAFNLGAAYIAIGNPETGLEYLHKALPPDGQRDEQSNGDLYYNMGLGHEKMENEDKALEDFARANEEYTKYERDKTDLQIQCLEKCFQIYKDRKDFTKAADVCKQMADVFNGIDELSKAERLCERATQLRAANKRAEATKAAEECKEVLVDSKPHGQNCIVAGKIWNDLGLVFTQLQAYDQATDCFEKAVEQVRSSHKSNPQLEAVVLQNLGAAYNFEGDYQRAIKFHEDAAAKYASINYRNGQGQCFTNLAFALSQLGEREMKQAELAFHHALQASKDTGDKYMKWQAQEGLGAVNYNQGHVDEAVKHFMDALQCVGENKMASERIRSKLMLAMKGSEVMVAPDRGHGQMMYALPQATTIQEKRVFMPTHGPLEEHNKLSMTPRSQVVEEEVITRETFVPVTGERPAMAAIQETPTPRARRLIRLRKRDSVGPHFPKMALGLGSVRYDSPTMQSTRRSTMLQEESSQDSESSSTSASSSESDSGEDEADQTNIKQPPISSEKINQIFERPKTPETDKGVFVAKKVRMSPGTPGEDARHISEYEDQIRAQEEDEENDDESEEDSSDESSSSSDDDDDDSDDDDDKDQTHVKQPFAPPPVPTQSPPSTTKVSMQHMGTYLTPDPHTVHTVADVHQKLDSSHRVARQPQQTTAESPREKTSSTEDSDSDDDKEEEEEDDDDDNDEKTPYATIDTATKLRQTVNGQGNDNPAETSFKRQRSGEGRRSENFFDSDRSSLDHNEKKTEEYSGEDTEDNYDRLRFKRDDGPGQSGESSRMKFDQLPRGQKEAFMAQYHKEHEGQLNNSPPLPARPDEKSSKTCVIM